MLRFLQFWCKYNTSRIVETCPFRFVFQVIIIAIPSMLRFPSFLTISYRFPWCFHMFPLVFLRFSVFLLFPPSVSPVSYFRFCGNNDFAVTSIFLYSGDCFNIEMNTLISSSTITYLILTKIFDDPILCIN